MLSENREDCARCHCYSEETETILSGSQDPGKNQLSHFLSLEEVRSSRKDGIMGYKGFKKRNSIYSKGKHQVTIHDIFYCRIQLACRRGDAHGVEMAPPT